VLLPARDYKNRHASILLALEAACEAMAAARPHEKTAARPGGRRRQWRVWNGRGQAMAGPSPLGTERGAETSGQAGQRQHGKNQITNSAARPTRSSIKRHAGWWLSKGLHRVFHRISVLVAVLFSHPATPVKNFLRTFANTPDSRFSA
jgi:hypothetical protein